MNWNWKSSEREEKSEREELEEEKISFPCMNKTVFRSQNAYIISFQYWIAERRREHKSEGKKTYVMLMIRWKASGSSSYSFLLFHMSDL